MPAGQAVKVCAHSPPGKGPDNYEPWYNARFQFNVDKDETVAILDKVAKDNGFGGIEYRGSSESLISAYAGKLVRPAITQV